MTVVIAKLSWGGVRCAVGQGGGVVSPAAAGRLSLEWAFGL